MQARGRLSPRLIHETALALVDAEGAAALSMRRLGDELGVNPMAVYKHVPNKAAVLAGAADLFVTGLDLPLEPDLDWRAWLRRLAAAIRQAFLDHPHLFDLLMAHPGREPVRAVYEALAGVMRADGFDDELIHAAWHGLQTHVIGHAFQERAWDGGGCDLPAQFDVGLDLLLSGLATARGQR